MFSYWEMNHFGPCPFYGGRVILKALCPDRLDSTSGAVDCAAKGEWQGKPQYSFIAYARPVVFPR